MFKEFIGRNVEVLIGFASSSPSGAMPPVSYFGVVKDADENSVKLSLVNYAAKKFNGELIEFNSKFIIYIKEVL